VSPKVDTFASGLVVLEVLTGYSINNPAQEYKNLLLMFEDKFDSPDKLMPHLDSTASWELHKSERVSAFHSIADRCLDLRRNRRPAIVDLIPKLEELRPLPVMDRWECVVCMEAGPDVKWMLLQPCKHACVCHVCCVGLVECPMCRSVVSDSFDVFF